MTYLVEYTLQIGNAECPMSVGIDINEPDEDLIEDAISEALVNKVMSEINIVLDRYEPMEY